MTEEEKFNEVLKNAIENKSETPPDNPQEFDVYSDNNYNLYMFVKDKWIELGLNVTMIQKSEQHE